MALLYGNENFPQPAVDELRRLGHDVLTVLETGKSDQAWPDEAVLTFATAKKEQANESPSACPNLLNNNLYRADSSGPYTITDPVPSDR